MKRRTTQLQKLNELIKQLNKLFFAMPFKSKAQMRKFGALLSEGKISEDTFRKWASETKKSFKQLPNKLKKKGKK